MLVHFHGRERRERRWGSSKPIMPRRNAGNTGRVNREICGGRGSLQAEREGAVVASASYLSDRTHIPTTTPPTMNWTGKVPISTASVTGARAIQPALGRRSLPGMGSVIQVYGKVATLPYPGGTLPCSFESCARLGQERERSSIQSSFVGEVVVCQLPSGSTKHCGTVCFSSEALERVLKMLIFYFNVIVQGSCFL